MDNLRSWIGMTKARENPGAAELEVAKDPGALSTRNSFTETDVEGHRGVYHGYGFQMPNQAYRRRGHHRRHHRHHNNHNSRGVNGAARRTNGEEGDDELADVLPQNMRPSDRVHFILGEDQTDGTHEAHPLFSELEELYVNGDEVEWRETARWIKFEEDVEEGGNRWSKPHVATISLHSLFELRSHILNGTVMLDLEATSLDQIADLILENLVNSGQINEEAKTKIKEALLLRKRHQHQHRHDRPDGSRNRLPIIRSLADIGRASSKSMFGSHKSLDKMVIVSHHDPPPHVTTTAVSGAQLTVSIHSPSSTSTTNTATTAAAATSIQFRGKNTLGVPARPGVTVTASDTAMHQSPSANSLHAEGSPMVHNSSSTDLHKLNQAFMRKIPPGCEADNILVGEIDYLEHSVSAFVRLKTASHLGDLTEVPVPTRFLFVLLGPRSIPGRYHEVGRSMATLMSDEVFHDVAYKAKSREDLLAGVDEFLDAVTILPPGAWDPSIRIEPPTLIPSQESRKKVAEDHKEVDSEEEEEREREASGLKRSGKFFGGLRNDIKRKWPWYWSDYKDAFVLQSVASIFFLYFACLTPIITFGGLLGDATGNNIATMESLMSGLLCGVIYGLFSGQPLTILGSTGPVLIFESILYDFCKTYEFHYLNFRLYIGLWMALILMIMVAYDMSAMVCYITRFTEENFATLISVIFIFKAFENLLHIGRDYPVNRHTDEILDYSCNCSFVDGASFRLQFGAQNLTAQKECVNALNGTLSGIGCSTPNYIPNVFYLSCILFASTYVISVALKEFKTSSFFPTKVRQVVSDFAVVIAIASMTLLDNYINLPTPKLFVPDKFTPTRDDRGWFIPFIHPSNPVWLIPIAIIPALLSTILIFMDQQITAVIINRKEYKLKKGCGYHLDLFVLSILVAICSVMGLPWFVAATVLAMTHVNSLKMESETSAPGEKPQFLGVREQRVTNIMIFALVGGSVFMTTLLQRIPMPVLFGVFLYMGTSSMKGSQFFERILIIFMPQKYQPDYIFLRHVPTYKVHIFTLIQLACFALLWAVKSFKKTAISFPLMLVIIIIVRKLLDFFFSRKELKILDDIMPESTKRKREEEKMIKEGDGDLLNAAPNVGLGLVPNTSSGNVSIPLANGNILKIPVDKIGSPTGGDSPPGINISEQLAKSGAWKSVNSGKKEAKGVNNIINNNNHNYSDTNCKHKRSTKNELATEEEQRRLSTMREEDNEEDCGITIKIEAPTPIPSSKHDNSETPV